MASPSTPDASRGSPLARAAIHPGPLALLIAGGAAGAAIASWPLVAAGAVAYAAGVAVLAAARGGAGGAGARCDGPLPAPDPRPITIRATEVMALVVRIRKGHAAMHRALCDTTDNIRAFCRPGYDRLCELVEHAWAVARRADEMKAHLDRSAPAVEIERERKVTEERVAKEALSPGAASAQAALAAVTERAATRARLEKELAEAIAGLSELGAALEGWHAKVLRMNAETPDRAEADSREVMDELERMDHLVRALEETAK